jgi:hypothetical protein
VTDWKTISVMIVIVAVMVVGLFAQTYFRYGVRQSQLTLVNRSSEAIRSARMTQGDSELVLEKIEPGESRSADFASHEGPITLVVTFRSGNFVSANKVGYLAAGLPVTVTFDITDSKVALRGIVKHKLNPQSYREP